MIESQPKPLPERKRTYVFSVFMVAELRAPGHVCVNPCRGPDPISPKLPAAPRAFKPALCGIAPAALFRRSGPTASSFTTAAWCCWLGLLVFVSFCVVAARQPVKGQVGSVSWSGSLGRVFVGAWVFQSSWKQAGWRVGARASSHSGLPLGGPAQRGRNGTGTRTAGCTRDCGTECCGSADCRHDGGAGGSECHHAETERATGEASSTARCVQAGHPGSGD